MTNAYFKGTKQIKPNLLALDDSAAERLWQISDTLTTAATSDR